MTVKATLAYGRGFHFYQEGLNSNYVYLELEDAPYDAGYRRVMVAIPVDVWEVIRTLGQARLDLVDLSDDDLLTMAEKRVDERRVSYERFCTSDPERAEVLRFENSIIFGAADEERGRQVMRGMEYYRTERERQRGIAARMAQHKIVDIGDEPIPDQTK
jgi:hypothetical protein